MAKQISQVQDIARLQPVQALPTATCAQVAQALEKSGQGFIPISTNGRPLGIITSWDLAKAIAQGVDCCTHPARAIMQLKPAKISESASLEEAARVMEEEQTRTLCVVNEEGRLTGTLTLNQLSQAVPEEAARVLQATAYEVIASEVAPMQAQTIARLKSRRATPQSEAA